MHYPLLIKLISIYSNHHSIKTQNKHCERSCELLRYIFWDRFEMNVQVFSKLEYSKGQQSINKIIYHHIWNLSSRSLNQWLNQFHFYLSEIITRKTHSKSRGCKVHVVWFLVKDRQVEHNFRESHHQWSSCPNFACHMCLARESNPRHGIRTGSPSDLESFLSLLKPWTVNGPVPCHSRTWEHGCGLHDDDKIPSLQDIIRVPQL